MKAYVIRNKEGKYYRHCLCDTSMYNFNDKNNPEFCDNLGFADFFDSIKDAKSFISEKYFNFNAKKFTVVPITIYEGDPLELACEKISSWEMNMPKDKMKDYFIQQAKEESDV